MFPWIMCWKHCDNRKQCSRHCSYYNIERTLREHWEKEITLRKHAGNIHHPRCSQHVSSMFSSGGRFCSSGSTWYRTEPRSDGNPPPSYGDRDLHHGPAGDRCLQLEIAVSSRGWLESSSAFPSSVHTKPCRGVYMYIRQLEVVVNGPTTLVWRTSAMGATRTRPILASC